MCEKKCHLCRAPQWPIHFRRAEGVNPWRQYEDHAASGEVLWKFPEINMQKKNGSDRRKRIARHHCGTFFFSTFLTSVQDCWSVPKGKKNEQLRKQDAQWRRWRTSKAFVYNSLHIPAVFLKKAFAIFEANANENLSEIVDFRRLSRSDSGVMS